MPNSHTPHSGRAPYFRQSSAHSCRIDHAFHCADQIPAQELLSFNQIALTVASPASCVTNQADPVSERSDVKNPIRAAALTLVRSSAWTRTSRWIRGTERWTELAEEFDGSYARAEIVAYFGDPVSKFYQLEQWLPVLEELNRKHKVAIVVRRPSSLLRAQESTRLPIVLKRKFDPLHTFYHANDFKLALYVNNGMTNFQSLGFAPMVHVHVNHGESDKLSMVSNQAKAYDRVFVAGQAAIDRHRKALLDFDESKLTRVGRPQLDVRRAPELDQSTAHTIMYAPTWEGENESNNYTSVDLFGPQIVEAVLGLENTRLIYKPHPRIESSKDPNMVDAHERIYELIDQANASIEDTKLQHQVLPRGDVLAMFDALDTLITDVSSVGLDFLYLRPDKPLILTDRRNDTQKLHRDAPVSRATPIINESTATELTPLIVKAVQDDESAQTRNELRTYYFGEGGRGTSTQQFFDEVSALINQRTLDLANFHDAGSSAESSE